MLQTYSHTDTNKALIGELYAAINAGNFSGVEAYFHPSFRHHSPAPGQPHNVHGVVQFWAQLRRQFPGLQLVVNDLIAEGDQVVVRGMIHFQGPFGRFIEILRVVEGQITDLWNLVTLDRGWSTDASAVQQPVGLV